MYHIKPDIIAPWVQRTFTGCVGEEEMALIFSYCAQVHSLVTGPTVEIKGEAQGCSKVYLICNVHQQGAQERRCKFWSLASIYSASLCIKVLYRNNVLVKLDHDLSVHEDGIPLFFFLIFSLFTESRRQF